MSVKNKGCGCLTLMIMTPAALFALSFLHSCVKRAFSPSTSYYEDVPGLTDQFVKEQLSGYSSASTPSKPSTPTGKFTIDLKSREGKDRRFQFNIKGRNRTGDLKMDVTEIGGGNSDFGGMVKFNVVFWDASNPEQKALKFQLIFNQTGGCYVTPAAYSSKTIYIADKERVCAKRFRNGEVFFAKESPALGKENVINATEITLPEEFVKIGSGAIETHNNCLGPFEPERQVYSSRTGNSR